MARRGRWGWAALALLTVATAACATMSVGSHVERGLDFSMYRTYDWGPADALPTGDPRLDRDPFFQDHMMGAVEKQLAAHGLQRATGEADLLIHYHASVTDRLNVNGPDQRYCASGNCPPDVTVYEAGTLVVDLVDRRTNRVVWRGFARDNVNLESVLGDRDRMEQRINEAVTRMMKNLPPSL